MDPHHHSDSLSCEIRILRAKNTNMINSAGELFVRCYLSAGNNNRVRLDTQSISSSSNLVWNQIFSLNCLGSEDSIQQLKQGSVEIELRWRSTKPLISRINGSKLLATAEIPWKDAFESTNMQIEKWVVMITKNTGAHRDFKLLAVQVGMKILESSEVVKRKMFTHRREENCGCMVCRSNIDYVDY